MQNSSGQIYLKNNIVANNTVNGSGEHINFDGATNSTYVNDNGYNIIENRTGSSITLNATGNITGNQANLNLSNTLEVNGTSKSVKTLKFITGSVAIDAVSSGANGSISFPVFDQRGAARTETTDIGTFELNGTLPVELSNFEAFNLNGNIVNLNWETVSEFNNEFFEVSSSVDVENWVKVCETLGVGFSNPLNIYLEIDRYAFIGLNYYQLKQIDFDVKYTLSKVISVFVNTDSESLIYPNPVNAAISVKSIGLMVMELSINSEKFF